MPVKGKEGQGAFIEISSGNYTSDNSLLFNNITSAYRVVDIVLDANHKLFEKAGRWQGIGTIAYDSVINPSGKDSFSLPLARPILSNNKAYPLIGEIVYIIGAPNTGIGEVTTSINSYYISTIGLWNTANHNAYPVNSNIPPPSQQKTYTMAELGSLITVTSQYTKLELGNTFIERGYIHSLVPYEGDMIYEGRWGNSIRFGSTIKTKAPAVFGLNNWSQGPSESGDPITIIRNGQPSNVDPRGWLPTVENINTDLTSIYLTSTQTIPLNASSISYFSYPNNPPQDINKFNGPQLIYNSGRIVLNTNQDHLLLSSIKSVNLNAIESVNIDAPTTIIQSGNILLGSKNATESVLLGDSTITTLASILDNMVEFLDSLKGIMSTGTGTPLVALSTPAFFLSTKLNAIKGNLEKIKSNTVKTV
jgi:ribosomal protein L30E